MTCFQGLKTMAKVVWGRKRPTVSFCYLLGLNLFISWLFKLRNLH